MELVSGNIFIRPMKFARAGDSIDGHKHNFDHTTYVPKGAAKIEQLRVTEQPADPLTREPRPPVVEVFKTAIKRASDGHNWVLIKAGVHHRITALEDDTVCHCIYSHRNPQGEIVQPYDGWEPAYATNHG